MIRSPVESDSTGAWLALDTGLSAGPTQTWIAVRKKTAGNIDYWRDLNGAERRMFDGSRLKEFKTLVDLQALTPLDLATSRRLREEAADRCIPTDWVERWKPQDDGSQAAKSRIVILGWKDPCLHDLPRSAPTPTCEGVSYVHIAIPCQ